MVSMDDTFALNVVRSESNLDFEPSYYVALGSDNSWYLFTEKWIKSAYKIGLPNVALAEGDAMPWETMRMLLDKEEMKWEKLSDSELGGLWYMEGYPETWSWSLNVPVLNSPSKEDECLHISDAYHDAVEAYKDQRNKVSRTSGFKEYKKIIENANFMVEKIKRLKARSRRLVNRIEQIEPSGWKEFLQIRNVIHETRTLDINTHLIFPLGETAFAIRGENEPWLAMVLRNKILLDLKPVQLAAVICQLSFRRY